MTRVIRADQHGPRVVPALLVDASEQASAIVVRARARAEAILAEAEAQASKRRDEAEQRGLQAGRTHARAELASNLELLRRAREELLTGVQAQTIELGMAAAEHIIARELATRPEAIAAIVQPLLDRLRRATSVTVHLHPEDFAWLEAERTELQCSGDLRLEANPQIARGGCLVTSEVGTLDARVETRLDVLADALKKASAQR